VPKKTKPKPAFNPFLDSVATQKPSDFAAGFTPSYQSSDFDYTNDEAGDGDNSGTYNPHAAGRGTRGAPRERSAPAGLSANRLKRSRATIASLSARMVGLPRPAIGGLLSFLDEQAPGSLSATKTSDEGESVVELDLEKMPELVWDQVCDYVRIAENDRERRVVKSAKR
jgi:hypothetical protein